jgi:uncharacterized membrane protein
MEPVDNPVNYKWGIIYYNKDDQRTFVPRALGWRLNFARWGSYVFAGVFVLLVGGSVILSLLKII